MAALLELDGLRLPLCPEAAAHLPSSLLRNNNDFRGIIRRAGNELLKNGHRVNDVLSLTSLPRLFYQAALAGAEVHICATRKPTMFSFYDIFHTY